MLGIEKKERNKKRLEELEEDIGDTELGRFYINSLKEHFSEYLYSDALNYARMQQLEKRLILLEKRVEILEKK